MLIKQIHHKNNVFFEKLFETYSFTVNLNILLYHKNWLKLQKGIPGEMVKSTVQLQNMFL